jgi:predicted Zn-dependent protease
MAQQYTQEGKVDEAEALLQPLLARRRLHFTEFAALACAEIDLWLAKGNREAARSWLKLWEQADPDNPNLPIMRRRVKGGLFGRLWNWGS